MFGALFVYLFVSLVINAPGEVRVGHLASCLGIYSDCECSSQFALFLQYRQKTAVCDYVNFIVFGNTVCIRHYNQFYTLIHTYLLLCMR